MDSLSFNDFAKIAQGKYNLGTVLAKTDNQGNTNLILVNNHKLRFLANNYKVSDSENKITRTKFFEAIRNEIHKNYGIGNVEDAHNVKLNELRAALLGNGNEVKNLTRKIIFDTISQVNNFFANNNANNEPAVQGGVAQNQNVNLQNANVNVANGDMERLYAGINAKRLANEIGIPTKAVKRILTNEKTAIQYLVHSQMVGNQIQNNGNANDIKLRI